MSKNAHETEQPHLGEELPVTDFTDQDTAANFLVELQQDGDEVSVRTRRSAGTYIHNFAMLLMDYESVLQTLIDNPNTAHICIDEHITKPSSHADSVVVSSHAGCGAAGVVHGMLQHDDKDAIACMASVLGQETVEGVKAGTITSDELGQLWSSKLVSDLEARGVKAVHEHLAVERYDHKNHKIHSATGAVVAVDPTKHSCYVPGTPDRKPFMVTNLRPGQLDTQALSVMAKEAVLASVIAFGDHGILGQFPEKKFAITVNLGGVSEFPQAEFEAQLQRFAKQFGVDMNRLHVTYHA